jgi:hypothetical protein
MKAASALDSPVRKRLITRVLVQFQKGQISLEAAADQLLTENASAEARKVKSNRRLKGLCTALQREHNPDKIQELKNRLSHEFYHGDEAA